ncbi:MAG: exodeoxyribonuclease VII large subunit [FCB group bacterium]|nr:exodeoxyribonuclease VII large subunit [FCB group bacterium]
MKVYSVGELTRTIKTILEDSLPSAWVEGEISDYTRHRSGHHYFTLKDSDSVLPCVMWKGRASSLSFTPQPGMKIKVQGRVTVFEKGGRYQFEAWEIQLSGEGELMAAFERLKKKLAEEGLFDREFKKPIPRFPAKIGLVTSDTGAAIRDLVTVAHRRNPAVELLLIPSRVQGDGAAEEIVAAIETFNRYRDVDLLIIGRGGGSLEDLWPFNEEIVARAIFASELPIISAVGHEVDYSISDLVADLRAPTPSAAAELAVPDAMEILRNLEYTRTRMKTVLQNRLDNLRERIDWARRSRAFSRPLEIHREHSQRMDENRRRLENAVRTAFDKNLNRLNMLQTSLRALNPNSVLERGYSITRKLPEETVVSDAAMLVKGDKIAITFAKGGVQSKIEKVEENRLQI